MSTGVIIALIVVGIVVVAAAGIFAARTASQGGPGLKRRFGPEYDRAVARHDGDTKAAEQELTERVKQHGSLREQPLEPAARERYLTRWAEAQERFVESPADAVVEADQLLADLAKERGFPDGAGYDEQFAALSVHHGPHVHGYHRVHHAAHSRPGSAEESRAGTEELRTAMVEARALFDVLLGTERTERTARRTHDTGTAAAARTDADTAEPHKQSRGGLKGRLAKGN
ncbi:MULTISPECIES: hypothetical protein [unclassified Streptomyces]|uniref:hypothetical protein n=1 Tax=unclassified Streptomyces TaxID=2593676 RepID=UPI000DC31DCC|nr:MULTISPECIES: hypothetical protein [unclassified Streptomyces]RAJ90602.1 hypothetical protein K377_01228 [Streptomyces sp. PsTaAH-137]